MVLYFYHIYMKQLVINIIAIGFANFSMAQTTIPQHEENLKFAEITFKETLHDFGALEYNSDVWYEFEFTNTGNAPLIISDVQGPDGGFFGYYQDRDKPIMPGENGKIKVVYDGRRTGKIDKKATIVTNAKTPLKEVFIKGEVLPAKPINLASIHFDTTTYNFGTITKGLPKTCDFQFTNTGNEPLIIQAVKSSCGCMMATWPKEPIMPTKQGVIVVQYSNSTVGMFTKTLTVECNAQNSPIILTVKGEATE